MPSFAELESLTDSWTLSLRAERKTAGTIDTYTNGLKAYSKWCRERGEEPLLSRAHVLAFLADFFDRGGKPTTAASYLGSLRRFAAWCVAESELPENELTGIRNPRDGVHYRPPLSAEEL